jgi:hypothetical protein
MSKEGHFLIVTPSTLQELTDSQRFKTTKRRTLICMKDVIPSPKRSTKLNLHLKSTRMAKSSGRSRTSDSDTKNLPSFLFDFLDEERPKLSKPNRDSIKQYEPKLLNLRKNTKINPNYETTPEEKFPELSVQRFWDRSQCKTSKEKRRGESNSFYKPYVIEITPRASVTLYGFEPINQPFANTSTPIRRSKPSKSMNMRNIAADKAFKLDPTAQPITINAPSRSFAEKLQRVQDIAKEAEDAFASNKF